MSYQGAASPTRWLALALAGLLLAACTPVPETGNPRSDVGSSSVSPTPPEGDEGSARTSYVVSLGDSYVSGEGARWAGNTFFNARGVDALGPDAYDDKGRRESQRGCHRAEESIVTLGLANLKAKNLACSGATTRSHREGSRFTPGLDFYRDERGNRGQALALEHFAGSHDVSHVVVSIGGNDFSFGALVTRCVTGFIGLGQSQRTTCSADADVRSVFAQRNAQTVTRYITASLSRVGRAMRRAGYEGADYTMIVLTYPSPLPTSAEVRYARDDARYRTGGCPFFDADLDWANDSALTTINTSITAAVRRLGAPNVVRLDLARALEGRRLCEQGVSTFPASRLTSWRAPTAARRLEWVNRIYFTFAPWQVQESLHPNYWGMRAEQDCMRRIVGRAVSASATCLPTDRLAADGSPVMRLVG